MVYVWEEPDFSVRLDHGRRINNEHRDGLVEIYLDRLVAFHGRVDFIHGPLRLIAQNPRREPHRVLHANASMTEVAARLQEQLRYGRTVQIDVVMIGEDEFDQTKRILGTGFLPNTQ